MKYLQLFNNNIEYIKFPIAQTLEWLSAYEKAYYVQPLYYYYWNEGALLGILPLCKKIHFQTRFSKKINLQYLGRGPSDFFQPLVQPGFESSFAINFSNWLRKYSQDWDELFLSEIPASWAGHTALAQSLTYNQFNVRVNETNGFYFVDTTLDWNQYLNSFLRPQNKDLLKDLRQIDRLNIQLRIESHREGVYAKLEQVLHLYAQRRASLGQYNTYETPERITFVKAVTESFEKKGWVELSFLKDQDDNIWAFQLDWLFRGIRYHWNHAYNEDFKKYSPGKILLYKLMERAFHRPEEIQCNHMRGLAGYKSKLANQMERLVEIHVYNPFSWRNRFAKIYNKVSYLKRLL
ncbi:MAG TPA: GNAT family N-acetyltransferase [Saprospiraceae bacterium]|nr:GNAT family N-acetyltransferase [Saprospiraceae bacterium]